MILFEMLKALFIREPKITTEEVITNITPSKTHLEFMNNHREKMLQFRIDIMEAQAEKNRKAVEEIQAFRDVGETFNYDGVTLTVRAIKTKGLDASYVDKNGVLHREFFSRSDLDELKRQNPTNNDDK